MSEKSGRAIQGIWTTDGNQAMLLDTSCYWTLLTQDSEVWILCYFLAITWLLLSLGCFGLSSTQKWVEMEGFQT